MPRAPRSSGPFNPQFQAFAIELDAANDTRERLVKASRDVTAASKKAIFSLHRANSSNKPSVLSSTATALSAIRQTIATRIVSELSVNADAAACFHRAYSPGIQEYVEARTLHAFLSDGGLLPAASIQAEIRAACPDAAYPFVLHPADYVLGVADLTGELMRLAVAAAARAERDVVHAIWRVMREVQLALEALAKFSRAFGRDYAHKMKTLAASVGKVERAACDLAVRAAEFGQGGGMQAEGMADRPVKRVRVE